MTIRSCITYAKSLAVFAALMQTLFGCIHRSPLYHTLPVLTDPAHYLQDVLDESRQPLQASGFVKMRITSPGRHLTTKNVFFVKRPYFVRFEVLGLFNQPSLFLVTDNSTLELFVPAENTLFAGQVDAASVASIIGFAIRPEDIVHAFLGTPPAFDYDRSVISWEQDNQYYYLEVSGNRNTICLWIDPVQRQVVKYALLSAADHLYQCTFNDFISVQGRLLPSDMVIDCFQNQTQISVHVESLSIDSFGDKMFTLNAPPRAQLRPLEDFMPTRK